MSSVVRYFDDSADYWDGVYAAPTVKGQIYRRRFEIVLKWILAVVPRDGRVADVGAGAGHLALALAHAGIPVTAVDNSSAMIDRVAAKCRRSDLDSLVAAVVSDAQPLALRTASHDVVAAVGLLPWVARPDRALAELARATRPGGHVVVTMDNTRSIRFLDPGWHPQIQAGIDVIKSATMARRTVRDSSVWPRAMSRRDFDRLIRATGLVPCASSGVGYGPVTFLGRDLLGDGLARSADRWLQRFADRGQAPIRSAAVFHVVLARRPVRAGETSPVRTGRATM